METLLSRPYDVAIVGGGFSGALLSIELINSVRREYRIAIVECAEAIGYGVAYATQCENHFLNVPSQRMSLFVDLPDHLLNWLEMHYPELADPEGFLPRGVYGHYVNTTYHEALANNSHIHVTHCRDLATELVQLGTGFNLTCLSGISLQAHSVILATGHATPSTPAPFHHVNHGCYVPSPWTHFALRDIPTSGRVLILGSGLTAIDQVLALEGSGFSGKIDLFSRRGRLPAVHAHGKTWPNNWVVLETQTLASLLKQVRRQILKADARCVDWRSVIDSLRPLTPELWRALPVEEKLRFLRHVRPFWETARHRMPQKSHDVIKRLIHEKRLEVLSGRISSVTEQPDRVIVTYPNCDSEVGWCRTYNRVINCTGPSQVERVPSLLLTSILRRGLGRLDPCKIGLETDSCGRLLDADGKNVLRLYGMGPVAKASNWEATAVAEIRNQARDIADSLRNL